MNLEDSLIVFFGEINIIFEVLCIGVFLVIGFEDLICSLFLLGIIFIDFEGILLWLGFIVYKFSNL